LTRISDNLYWQMPGERLAHVLQDKPFTGRVSPSGVQHVVNLYSAPGKLLDTVQARTVATMAAARASSPDVKLTAVVDPGDRSVVPPFFDRVVEFQGSLRDLNGFESERPLPLVFDLLRAGVGTNPGEGFLIFTNSDICLQPFFYRFVQEALAAGYDALIINRRTVHDFDPSLPSLAAAADLGDNHPGLDCFVFPAAWVHDFVRNNACVGIGYVMRGLLMNLVARAEALLVLTEAHLTYHYGDDRPWSAENMKHLQDHNFREAESVYATLAKDKSIEKRLSELFEIHPKYRRPAVKS
jgi:hypothetical protein